MHGADALAGLSRLIGSPLPELGCEECFAELDRFVELELARRDADRELPGFRAHLAGCPACHEDYESLAAFVAETDGAASA
jgi:hypothetical protein